MDTDVLMKEYAKRWYLFIACIVMMFPGFIAGWMVSVGIWGFRIMSSATSPLELPAFGLAFGVVSTLPIQILHIILCRRGVSKHVLAVWSAAWIFIFALIGLVILDGM